LKDDSPIKIAMRPSHPGAFLRGEVLEELGISTTKAAEVLGVRRATLSSLINERASLSPEMALRVEKAFGVSMELMLRMQALFDAHAMRLRAGTIDVERFVVGKAA
jgi:antitoxin HigA-1